MIGVVFSQIDAAWIGRKAYGTIHVGLENFGEVFVLAKERAFALGRPPPLIVYRFRDETRGTMSFSGVISRRAALVTCHLSF